MDIPKIKEKLRKLFFEEGYRIVFWNDYEGEFENILEELQLDDIEILLPNNIGQFKTKALIELECPTKKVLVYSLTEGVFFNIV